MRLWAVLWLVRNVAVAKLPMLNVPQGFVQAGS